MIRDISRFEGHTFDIAIIGGGIYGAAIAREASTRGLSTALVEKDDFGSQTSANMQKIVHAGFRYLQNLDFKRLRESSKERNVLLRTAPHLVEPIPFVIPTYKHWLQNAFVLRAALLVYDLLTWDRNRGIADPERLTPTGYMISSDEYLRIAPPGFAPEGLTGAALWFDGLVYNAERLTLLTLKSAVHHGAIAANYAKAVALLKGSEDTVEGLRVEDLLSGKTVDIKAKIVINASGPFVNQIAQTAGKQSPPLADFALSCGFITRAVTGGDNKIGLNFTAPHQQGTDCLTAGCCRRFHIAPWRGHSIIASYGRFADLKNPNLVTEDDLEKLIKNVNNAFPELRITRDDVLFIHKGLLPLADADSPANPYKLARHYRIIDHKKRDDLSGLISVVGVKYTTARHIAVKVIDLAAKQARLKVQRSSTHQSPLPGGEFSSISALRSEVQNKYGDVLSSSVIEQLIRNYGTAYGEVCSLLAEDPGLARTLHGTSDFIGAQVIHAVRHEMAVTLLDVVLRRTGLGTLGHPGMESIRACADLIASELKWTDAYCDAQIKSVEVLYQNIRGG